jgi:hypothetical protein
MLAHWAWHRRVDSVCLGGGDSGLVQGTEKVNGNRRHHHRDHLARLDGGVSVGAVAGGCVAKATGTKITLWPAWGRLLES